MQGTRASQTWSLLQNTAINLVSCIAPMANTLGTAHLTTSSMSKLKTQTWMSLHKHRTRSNAFSPPSFRFGAFLRKAQNRHRANTAPSRLPGRANTAGGGSAASASSSHRTPRSHRWSPHRWRCTRTPWTPDRLVERTERSEDERKGEGKM